MVAETHDETAPRWKYFNPLTSGILTTISSEGSEVFPSFIFIIIINIIKCVPMYYQE